MPEIQYIKNVTAQAAILNVIPEWDHHITGMPDLNPDECVVRSISFNGSIVDTNAYLVWSNLQNDFIGSFCGGSINSISPQITLRLNNPVPNSLHFKLYTPSAPGLPPYPAPAMIGDLIIHLDFIKYKRTPMHA